MTGKKWHCLPLIFTLISLLVIHKPPVAHALSCSKELKTTEQYFDTVDTVFLGTALEKKSGSQSQSFTVIEIYKDTTGLLEKGKAIPIAFIWGGEIQSGKNIIIFGEFEKGYNRISTSPCEPSRYLTQDILRKITAEEPEKYKKYLIFKGTLVNTKAVTKGTVRHIRCSGALAEFESTEVINNPSGENITPNDEIFCLNEPEKFKLGHEYLIFSEVVKIPPSHPLYAERNGKLLHVFNLGLLPLSVNEREELRSLAKKN